MADTRALAATCEDSHSDDSDVSVTAYKSPVAAKQASFGIKKNQQYEVEEKRRSSNRNSKIYPDDGLVLRAKVSPEAQRSKRGSLYAEDMENSRRLKKERHAVEIQLRDRLKKSPETTPEGSVLSRGSKTHHILLQRSDLPNDNQSVKFERALIPIRPSSSLPSHPRSVSSETIDEESDGSNRMPQAKSPRPKRGPTYGSSNGFGDDADGNERGIEDAAVDLENSDEFGLKTETERDSESDEELQSYQDDVERILGATILGVKNILLQELSNCALFEATDNPGYSNTQSSSPRSQGNPVSSSSKAPHQPQRRKRARGDGRDPEDGGNESDDDEDDRPKKKNEKRSPDRLPHRRLKCPFYQRQPEKYARAACRGEGFADMAKLKQDCIYNHQ
jgi:hypothetical protein